MTEIFQDIRRTYSFAGPGAAYADRIEFYGETCLEKTGIYLGDQPYTIRMFPSWTPSFFINLGTSYRMTMGRETYVVKKDDHVLISRHSIVERINDPGDHIFIVKFHPGGLESVLGISQAGIGNNIIDLRAILPDELLLSLKNAGSLSERCLLMDRYFETLPGRGKTDSIRAQMVRQAINEYVASNMELKNAALAEKYLVSSKTINRCFHHIIGTSPKRYFSTLRARLALNCYVKDRQHFNPYQFGYFDRSHFYKNVLSFTGQKISDYL